MILIVAKPGGTSLYRLHFGYVEFCYTVPYLQSIFKLWTNCGLAAFGLDILWTARKISTDEGCSLIGLFRHCIDMAVPGQSIVYSGSKILGFRSFIQGLSMKVVGIQYVLSLVCDPDVFAPVMEYWYLYLLEYCFFQYSALLKY